MGKKGPQKSSLGRIIIKDRYGKRSRDPNSLLHTSELQDGQDWGRLNLQSITEQTHVDEFLSTAELAGTEFLAVKLNVKFVQPILHAGMPTVAEKHKIEAAQDANKEMLRIPRRPAWNMLTTPEQLAEAERSNFLTWRRSLSELQEVDGITLTPFEKNLEFWRQLWRVIERSDVVVQIVDARNPLMFRCEDLEAYVEEVSPDKDNLLLINKSDFLTQEQREAWAEYFQQNNIKAVFFSALVEELDEIQEEEERTYASENEEEDKDEEEDEAELSDHNHEDAVNECRQDIQHLSSRLEQQHISPAPSQPNTSSLSSPAPCPTSSLPSPAPCPTSSLPSPAPCPTSLQPTPSPCPSSSHPVGSAYVTSSQLMNRVELMEVLRTFHTGSRVAGKAVTIGLVGYPNVGKSSTINCLMQEKKVSVSATPGKTKHFQTLFLAEDILLCDCPGLVFPAFITTKQEMIISGILPIDQMRDEVPPVNLIVSRIPRQVFESRYGIKLPPPREGEDPHRPPTSEELLNAYGLMRGYMTQRGLPDNPRSSRYILKDFMNGKLLYCHAPPGSSQDQYHIHDLSKITSKKGGTQAQPTPQQIATQPFSIRPEVLDRKFFGAATSQFHIKGINTGGKTRIVRGPDGTKQPRSKNSKKKEKLRRRFAHLDE